MFAANHDLCLTLFSVQLAYPVLRYRWCNYVKRDSCQAKLRPTRALADFKIITLRLAPAGVTLMSSRTRATASLLGDYADDIGRTV